MPTYEYACTSCGHHLEVSQSFSDEPLTTCPNCGGDLRKVFGSIGIVLKGSGFYKTDSRSSGSKAAASAAKKESGGSDSGTSKEPAASGTSSNGSSASSSEKSSSEKSSSEKSSTAGASAAAS